MWGQIMGTGIVNAVDDMRVTNPPSNPALLDALANDFVAHKFDLKQLLRTILKSEVYSLSANPIKENASDRQNFARYKPKRMPAEVLLDAVGAVTGAPEHFFGFPNGTRAIGLPDQAVGGRSERETACECERSYAPNLSQTLHLMNSPEIQDKLSTGNGIVSKLIAAKKSSPEIVEEMFLRALSRKPTANELKDAVTALDQAKDRKGELEDFEWVLLNSKEFMFNH
jgi:hypothetical protein